MTTDRLFRYRGRLVSAPPELVWAAQAVPIGSGSGRDLGLAAGLSLALVAGILGAGAVYLFAGSREPKRGEPVLVIPGGGEQVNTSRGSWDGYDPYGNFLINGRPRCPDELEIVAPLIYKNTGHNRAQEIVDLSRGWASHKALAAFRAAHSREGYTHRREKRNK